MIIRQAVKSNRPLPNRIENSPSLLPGLELYYIGFLSLDSSRQMGFQIGPISWITIHTYCEAMELDEYQTEAMHHHISAMDLEYLKHQAKKAKK